jgi:hypothetical protein
MAAISRSITKLWVTTAGVNPSALTASSTWSTSLTTGYIAGQIKSYTKSGGENDVESDAVFGGYIDKEKPVSQFEVEFTIVPALESSTFEWEKLAYSLDSTTGTAVYTSKGIALSDQAFFIQASDGTSHKSWAFNNCNVVMLDMEHNADDNMSQTLRLKFSPTTDAGKPNFQYSKQAVTGLTNWASLSSN